jgi:hypothetical protein
MARAELAVDMLRHASGLGNAGGPDGPRSLRRRCRLMGNTRALGSLAFDMRASSVSSKLRQPSVTQDRQPADQPRLRAFLDLQLAFGHSKREAIS